MNSVAGGFQARTGRQRFSAAEVSGVLGMGAAGDLQPQAVPRQQPVGAGRQPQGEVPNLGGVRNGVESDECVGDVVGAVFWVDIADAYEDVGVRNVHAQGHVDDWEP